MAVVSGIKLLGVDARTVVDFHYAQATSSLIMKDKKFMVTQAHSLIGTSILNII